MEERICLDLGCGMRKGIGHPGERWVGVDIRAFEGVDYVLDIGKDKLPLEDNSVDFIRCIHTYEHLYPEQLFFSIEECFRVIKPLGYFNIEVPKAGTKAYFIHPDHKIQFIEDTFGFFQVPAGGIDPHGYLKGFWHISILKDPNPENISVNLYPNKKGGKYPYVEVKTYS